MDNPFGSYFASPADPARRRPQGKRRRRRRREAEPQTIGTNPEVWPPPEPETFDEVREQPAPTEPIYRTPAEDDGFTGDWNDWTDGLPAAEPPQRTDDIDWNDWATTTATEQSGDHVEMPVLPRLKDFGGGGTVTRRPRKRYDDERYDDPHGRAKAAAAVKGVVGALIFVALVGVAANIFLGSGDQPAAAQRAAVSGAPATGSTATTVAPPPAHAVAGCETFRSQSITISAERGDTATPQGAILGFEYSYYVDRDAAKARTYVTDDAHVGDESALAAGIATFPTGVKYCIHITRADSTDPTVWNVTVQQQWPGGTEIEKIQQTMRTAEVAPGRYRITSIDHRN
ncbi:hypothetical protein [Nocardia asteroides]|uniref:DUF8176 domain-containing protein n=1 Tax=Nocardia asteroides NBRC 15531 TaxID=1110697 RepID=U5E6P1_NOCAS|nr:hypothetical protein [Nocardia asteroides]UGT47961.1 hypothetical protein LT345_26290 [Nocardia asteroides]GAD82885.1 hypothetical protein NCAST_13_01600 [Nocardia asteroides NBRC 15531]SFM60584.1 hypothetical protein SAMN05444423_103555 [Nocardia asteroides]VEG33103.1 Uncharacterised protein [Nocardia asteroides]